MRFVNDCVCVRIMCFVCDFCLCDAVWCVVSVVCVVFVCVACVLDECACFVCELFCAVLSGLCLCADVFVCLCVFFNLYT